MNTIAQSRPFTRSIGFWMALLLIASQLMNAARAFADPVAYSTYFGLPTVDASATGFVMVYGLRALFLAVFAAVLIVARQIRALSLMALAAVIMPIGDAILTAQAGAPISIIARHVVIGLFLIAAWFFLRRFDVATNARDGLK
jgi:Domain of unknown function (DUF4267)